MVQGYVQALLNTHKRKSELGGVVPHVDKVQKEFVKDLEDLLEFIKLSKDLEMEGTEIYSKLTGETIADIATATREEIKKLLEG